MNRNIENHQLQIQEVIGIVLGTHGLVLIYLNHTLIGIMLFAMMVAALLPRLLPQYGFLHSTREQDYQVWLANAILIINRNKPQCRDSRISAMSEIGDSNIENAAKRGLTPLELSFLVLLAERADMPISDLLQKAWPVEDVKEIDINGLRIVADGEFAQALINLTEIDLDNTFHLKEIIYEGLPFSFKAVADIPLVK